MTSLYDLVTDLPNHWNNNADPLLNSMPLVNNDIWIIGVFLLSNIFFRYIVDITGTKKALEKRTNGFRFIYHCFFGGLCGACFAIGFLITDWERLAFTCERFNTFSTYGFSGHVKMWMCYFAFLGKMTQVVEFIWRKSKLGIAVSLTELIIALFGIKFDATPAIWLAGAIHIPFGLFTHYWNGIEITKTENPGDIREYRRKMTIFFLICELITAYSQGLFTLAKCSTTDYPLHYTIIALLYPIFSCIVYPKIYVDAFSSSSSTPSFKKVK
jgi:hypothetical protein